MLYGNQKRKNQKCNCRFFGAQGLGAQLEVETQLFSDTLTTETISFDFCNSYDLQLFKKVREYTEAKKIDEMKGKIIRLVYFSDIREAFGDAIDNKFVYFAKSRNESGTIREFSEDNLKVKYNELSRGPQ